MNRTERALKKQSRKRMQNARDSKRCLIDKIEGVFSPYNSLEPDSMRTCRIKELRDDIKEERREKHSIYAKMIEINKNIYSHAEKSSKEVIGV